MIVMRYKHQKHQKHQKHPFIKRILASFLSFAVMVTVFICCCAQVSAASEYIVVTGKSVNVRSNAGTSYSVIGTAHKGDRYEYIGVKKNAKGQTWYLVRYSKKKQGWISAKYTKKSADKATTKTTAKTTVKTTAKTNTTSSQPIHLYKQQEGFVGCNMVPDKIQLL